MKKSFTSSQNGKIKKIAKKLKDKKVFLRVDFNVPMTNGKIREEKKIIAVLPTIRFLLRYKAKVIIATHLGRPEGKVNKKYSTKPLATRLGKILGPGKVFFVEDIIGKKTKEKLEKLKSGQILFLENLRFTKLEKKNDKKFAKELAGLADIYVNEAFSVTHRKHASVCAIKDYIPSYFGFLLEDELKSLNKVIKPKKPLIVIMGGAKIDTKIKLIKNLEPKASKILIGGALANNFFASQKIQIGKSLIDKDSIKIAKKLKSKKIILPIDVIVLSGKKAIAKKLNEVTKDESIMDIGPETIKLFAKYINNAKTLIWNGPLGLMEDRRFKHGTLAVAQAFAAKARGRAFGLAGGGETIEALKKADIYNYIDWVSTAGGAMLAYLGGEEMPGLKK